MKNACDGIPPSTFCIDDAPSLCLSPTRGEDLAPSMYTKRQTLLICLCNGGRKMNFTIFPIHAPLPQRPPCLRGSLSSQNLLVYTHGRPRLCAAPRRRLPE